MNTTALKTDMSRMHNETEVAVRPAYLEALTLVERLHRRLLDVIKDEFDRRGRSDVNSVQALLLYNIGDKELTAGELRTKGYYLGSNVSYNVKKLVELGFLHHARSRLDRRSGAHQPDAEGQGGPHDRRRALRQARGDGWSRSAASRPGRVRRPQQVARAPRALLDRPDPASASELPCSTTSCLLRYSYLSRQLFFVSCESLPRERGRRAAIPGRRTTISKKKMSAVGSAGFSLLSGDSYAGIRREAETRNCPVSPRRAADSATAARRWAGFGRRCRKHQNVQPLQAGRPCASAPILWIEPTMAPSATVPSARTVTAWRRLSSRQHRARCEQPGLDQRGEGPPWPLRDGSAPR